MKKSVLDTTVPFRGLPEPDANDEGLVAREGFAIEWAGRDTGVEKKQKIHRGMLEDTASPPHLFDSARQAHDPEAVE